MNRYSGVPEGIARGCPWFFGIRFILLIAAWDGYCILVGFRLILPKRHAGYHDENTLFREMVREFTPPSWATSVIVSGDAAYGSKANIKMAKDRDKADDERRWGFVFAVARTWKTILLDSRHLGWLVLLRIGLY